MTPTEFLDKIRHVAAYHSDAELARNLNVHPPVLSKIRHQRIIIGPTFLIQIHELTGLEVRQMKEWLGVPSLNSLASIFAK